VERGDFCHATSANHFKMVHGGIRYLQHGDLIRLRESSNERRALLRIAPHLVQPLPIVIPTYGHSMQGKALLAAGLRLYDLLAYDRNRGLSDPQRQIPQGRLLSRQECLARFPALEKQNPTGAALFYDGQMYNPPRLALAFLQSALQRGAHAGNYLEVKRFLSTDRRIYGVVAYDHLSGTELDIRGKVVLNAAGPWAEQLLAAHLGLQLDPPLHFSRDVCFVVARPLIGRYALAVLGRTKDPDALLSRGQRHLFIVPWRQATLIGVWHRVYRGDPDAVTITEEELGGFLDEINAAYPPFDLTLHDISMKQAGLVLFGENQDGTRHLRYGKRSCLIDHARVHRLEGLITLVGVRATTARGMAAKAIDLVLHRLNGNGPKSRTAVTPLYGGDIEQFDQFLNQAVTQRPPAVSPETMRGLVHNYGTAYPMVLRYLAEEPGLAATLGNSTTLKAEVVHAVREEMAQKLSDVVFRRTDLGTMGHPGMAALSACAELMATELSWDAQRVNQELAEVCDVYASVSHAVRTV
jgi:glycerol-3-phosphate dehydrogenase